MAQAAFWNFSGQMDSHFYLRLYYHTGCGSFGLALLRLNQSTPGKRKSPGLSKVLRQNQIASLCVRRALTSVLYFCNRTVLSGLTNLPNGGSTHYFDNFDVDTLQMDFHAVDS